MPTHAEKHLSPSATNTPPAPLLSEKIPQMPSKESVKNVTNSVIGGMGGFVSMLSKKQPQQTSSSEGEQQEQQQTTSSENEDSNNKTEEEEPSSIGGEVEVVLDGILSGGGPGDTPSNVPATPKSLANPFTISSPASPATATAADTTTTTSTATTTTNDDKNKNDTSTDELEKLSAELGDLSAMTEAFDLLGDDFNLGDVDVDEHAEELLDAMDEKEDPFVAFAIDDEDFLS